MDDMQVGLFAFLGMLELALLLLAVSIIFLLRGNRLSRKVGALEKQLKTPADVPEPVGFDQYLRDEIIRNEALTDQAAASEDESEKKAAELLKLRKQFLEIELEAHALEANPVAFQDRIAAGLCELMEVMRPDPETVETEAMTPEAVELEEAPDDGEEPDADAERKTVDTSEEEIRHLKDVINNQQDAMSALRTQLEKHSSEVGGMDSVLQQLEDFEKQSTELERCLLVLESENERLKAAQDDGSGTVKSVDMEPAQLTGLKHMVGGQQETIDSLRKLLGDLIPEADRAGELEETLNRIQHTNRELSGCVTLLEDENTNLRNELQMIELQLQEQDAQREADAAVVVDVAVDEPDSAPAREQIAEMEIKVQELEALVEFKDATIEELEKQYNALEGKYREAAGEQNA